jgi:hypothetical protein
MGEAEQVTAPRATTTLCHGAGVALFSFGGNLVSERIVVRSRRKLKG